MDEQLHRICSEGNLNLFVLNCAFRDMAFHGFAYTGYSDGDTKIQLNVSRQF